MDGLGLVRVEGLQIEELLREVRVTIQGYQVGHTLFAFASEAALAGAQASVPLDTRLGLPDAQ